MDKIILTEKISQVAAENGFIFVDLYFSPGKKKALLRVLVDSPGRITLDECSAFSRKVEDMIDRELFIDSPYILEVSSPGIGRKLVSDADWKRTVGRKLQVQLDEETFEDILTGYDGEFLIFDCGRKVPVSTITMAVEVI